jgi:tetraacyldisaccharide 4'-kinase
MYQGVTGIRNVLYDFSLRRSYKVDAKVIAIGNLTLGGTGKTPVTLAMIEALKKKKYSVGVVSRGYKRGRKGINAVQDGPKAAMDFGDEPTLIKVANPEVPVYVGEKRVKAARKLLEDNKVDFIIADDAFQHRSLARDLNVLLLDSTELMKWYRVLPVGNGRESAIPALKRADYFVLTKTNLAEPEQIDSLVQWLKEKSDRPVLKAPYVFRGLRSLRGEFVQELRDTAYLVSGVAKPWTIERVLGNAVKIVKHKSFDDHHRYTHLEIDAILDETSEMQARWILTTAKDAVKLRHFNALKERLWIVDMGVELQDANGNAGNDGEAGNSGDLKTFYADIDRLARACD